MKRSELKEFIKGEIFSSLSEASPEDVNNQKELNKELEKTSKLSKEIGLEEANIGLANLEETGYEDGEKAISMHFNHDVIGINNIYDFGAYRRGFVQSVMDNTKSFKLGEYEDQELEKTSKLSQEIGLEESLNPEVSQKVNQFIKAMAKRYDYSEQDAVYAIMAALKQREFDGVNEDVDDIDDDKDAIAQAKAARGKHKKLDIAVKALKDITTEMKSLARDYSQADGAEKEKIKDQLKVKTPKKKELEALVAKLEKNVI